MEKEKNHTPAEVAENIKSIIKGKYKDLTEYAHEKNITATQLYNILNGKDYMSLFSAFRFSSDFDLNLDYCTRGELPVLSPDHDFMELLEAATGFYYAVQDEDNLRDEYLRRQGTLSDEEDGLFRNALKKARIAKAKAGCELVDVMNKGWAEENPEDDIPRPEMPENLNTMTLHEAIGKVLREAAGPLTFTQITKLVNKEALYARKDGKPVPASQISARVKNYPQLFSVDKTASPVLISLSNNNR